MKHFLLYALLLLPFCSVAQDDYYPKKGQSTKPSPRPVYTIVLKDGTELRGELLRQDSTEAVIRTKNLGEVRLRSDQIVRIEQQDVREPGGTYVNLFPQTMRMAPTAFSAEKGRAYFRNYGLSLSQFEYGMTDNWSVGTTFYSFLPTNLFSFNTKVSFPVGNRLRLGVNAQYIAARFDGSLEGFGYVQGIVTTGDRQNNTTYGLGATVSNGQVSSNLVGTFGLVRKVSPKLTFISENFVLIGGGTRVSFAGMLSGGIRFDRRRHAFDLAAYIPIIIGPNVSLPFFCYPTAVITCASASEPIGQNRLRLFAAIEQTAGACFGLCTLNCRNFAVVVRQPPFSCPTRSPACRLLPVHGPGFMPLSSAAWWLKLSCFMA